jgi:predicted transcriptional regulator
MTEFSTFIISVRPLWANAFFLDSNPKILELRKGSFGASLKAGDIIVIYSTLPEGNVIGKVQVVNRQLLSIPELWYRSQYGELAKVSRQQFDTYYANHESAVAVWVDTPEFFSFPFSLNQLRQIWGQSWQPPQQIQQLRSPLPFL